MNIKNTLFTALLILAPTLSYANVQDTVVPYALVRNTIQGFPKLYDSNFIVILDKQTDKRIITLGNLAQICIDYTKMNTGVTRDMCTDFMNKIISAPAVAPVQPQVVSNGGEFVITTTDDTKNFEFEICAAGKFYLDCGDGQGVQTYNWTDVTLRTLSCKYNTAKQHTIKLSGRATDYDDYVAVIDFQGNKNLAKIDGGLGSIFPTLGNNKQPKFSRTFMSCTNLTGSIPENLFSGITGAPKTFMFSYTFAGCTNLTGSIPEKLFSGITGTPTYDMFDSTFKGCTNLTGSIPEKLFSGITGAPAKHMFDGTFSGCEKLSGDIPQNLFKKIKGSQQDDMYDLTFYNCKGLTGTVGPSFFGKITPQLTVSDVNNAKTFEGSKIKFSAE